MEKEEEKDGEKGIGKGSIYMQQGGSSPLHAKSDIQRGQMSLPLGASDHLVSGNRKTQRDAA